MRRIKDNHDNSVEVKNRMKQINRNEMNVGKSSVKNDGPDRIYYNVSIPHNDQFSINGSPTIAKFFEVRENNLFDGKPKDFSMSVVRFTIPSGYIPLLFFNVTRNPMNPNDPNYSIYTVTLSYLGNDFQTRLIYQPQNIYVTVPPGPSSGEPTQRTKYVNYYSVYSPQHMLNLINIAFNSSFTALKTAFPAAPITLPPFMTYITSLKLFAIIAQPGYLTTSTPGNVDIYINTNLGNLFETSFDTIYYGYSNITNGKNQQFVIKNLGNNFTNGLIPPSIDHPLLWSSTVNYLAANNTIVSWNGLFWIVAVDNINSQPSTSNPNWSLYTGFQQYEMTQEYNTIPQWLPFTSLVFTSGALPFRSEWISGGNNPQNNIGATGLGSQSFRPILTDFEIDFLSGFEIRSFIHYSPTAEYRRIDLIGDTPIRNIDIDVWWKDNYDNLYPILIPEHEEVSIKILFERKKKSIDNSS